MEEKKEEVLYKADPLTFIFRELDLMRGEIREFKSDTKEEFANVNKRLDNFMLDVNKRFEGFTLDVNKRFDDVNRRFDDVNRRFDDVNRRFDDVNKRFDRLYLIVILNLLGIVAFLIKGFFF